MDANFNEIDNEYHGVFESAMESTIITNELREKLPDSSFGIVFTNDKGEKERKYPLIIPGDKETSRELQQKAIAFFHFAKPEWRESLAKKIVEAIKKTQTGVKISPKSQINKYVEVPEDMLGTERSFSKKDK